MKNITIINGNRKDIEELEGRTVDIFDKVATFFKIKDLPKIVITFHTSRSDYGKSIGRNTQDWEVGNTSQDKMIQIIHPDYFEKISSHKNSEFDQILTHEIAHIFIHRISSGNMIPVWLNEGLAMNIAGQLTKYKDGKPIYIEQNFSSNLASQNDWEQRVNNDAYKLACLFTAFLIEKFSFEKIIEIVKKTSKNYDASNFELLFKSILGKSVSDSEKDFVVWLENIKK